MFVERNGSKVQSELGKYNTRLILCYQLLVCTLLVFYPIYGSTTLLIIPLSLVLKFVLAWRSVLIKPMLMIDIVLGVLAGIVYVGTISGNIYTPLFTAAAFIWARMNCDFMLPAKSALISSSPSEVVASTIIAVFNCIIAICWAIAAVW
jgi:hypothetical protein